MRTILKRAVNFSPERKDRREPYSFFTAYEVQSVSFVFMVYCVSEIRRKTYIYITKPHNGSQELRKLSRFSLLLSTDRQTFTLLNQQRV